MQCAACPKWIERPYPVVWIRQTLEDTVPSVEKKIPAASSLTGSNGTSLSYLPTDRAQSEIGYVMSDWFRVDFGSYCGIPGTTPTIARTY